MSHLQSKGLTDEINLIYVEEVRGSNASFVISSLLCNALKKNASVLFVTLHNSFQHYQHVCSKLGYNINNASLKSKIEVMNPLEIPFIEENNLNFFSDFNEKTEIFFQNHEGEQYLIIDDLSYLLLLTNSQDCIRFVLYYLYQRSLYPNLKVIICYHISPEDKESFIITNFIRSICRFIIKLTPLSSGLSSEVTGHMEITHRKRYGSDSTECNYLLSRKGIVLNPTVI